MTAVAVTAAWPREQCRSDVVAWDGGSEGDEAAGVAADVAVPGMQSRGRLQWWWD